MLLLSFCFPCLAFWHRLGAAAPYEFFPERYSAPRKVVRGKLHLDLVAGKYFNIMHTHFPADMREDLVAALYLDSEHRVRQRLEYFPFN